MNIRTGTHIGRLIRVAVILGLMVGLSGQLYANEASKNGKPDGPFKYYYKNGKLKKEVIFKNGEPVAGAEKDYGENGQLKQRETKD